jgi:acyl-CoA synthetase (AMP-forming)/AMP-acid ligase II
MNLSGLTNCYGLTESSPIVVQTDVYDTLITKLSSVGRVLPHSAIRVAARDNPAQTLYRGEKGEIQIAGYAVMQGYWESEEETNKALIQVGDTTWLRSGDEGLIAEDGTIQITGRIKDIIIRGGENIYPAEIEDCLLKHEQVSCASVVGLPDARYGETITAFIQPREGVAVCISDQDKDFSANLGTTIPSSSTTSILTTGQIRDWVRNTLAKSLVPRHVFWVSNMPLTTSGKIEKFRLREMGEIYLSNRH